MRANPFESQLERLARTLTEQFGVKVICQGDNAWTDGRQIVLPSLPEPLTRRAGDARGPQAPRHTSGPASQPLTNPEAGLVKGQGEPSNDDLERLMIGYLDHEMAHVAFSDFGVAEQFARKHPGFEGMLNVVEDALIERRAMQRWPGVRVNLDATFGQIHGRIAALIAQRSPFDRSCAALAKARRSLRRFPESSTPDPWTTRAGTA